MPTLAISGDVAGGPVTATGQMHVKVDGTLVVTVGDPVAGHGTGAHAGATMAAGSSVVKINGTAACRTGDAATCGHTITGSSHVEAS